MHHFTDIQAVRRAFLLRNDFRAFGEIERSGSFRRWDGYRLGRG